MIDKEHNYCIGKVGYDKGYKKGRADAIAEYQKRVRNILLLIECMEDAVEIVDKIAEQMKENK